MNQIANSLIKGYVKTGKYLQVGGFAENAFTDWCLWAGIIADDTPLTEARTQIYDAWRGMWKAQEGFYQALKDDGLWQAGYDAMSEDEKGKRFLAALDKGKHAEGDM